MQEQSIQSNVGPSSFRAAYSLNETAAILGISYASVHRLLKRRLLKASGALRHKRIPKSEIDRFLQETLLEEPQVRISKKIVTGI